ncbi:MAG: hypothetical protein IKP10_05045 [Clostridia bacterium]|nr:hypothetical protein [Clostridia bacterium]
MDEARVRGLMGLCARARQAVFGEDGCLKTIRSGDCALLLLDAEASAATKSKYAGSCASHGVPLRMLPAGLLADATGRPGVAMAVRRGGLANQLLTCLPGEDNDTDTQMISGGASVE